MSKRPVKLRNDIFRSIPDTIAFEDKLRYRLEADPARTVKSTGRSALQDLATLRKAQLALARQGQLDCFVSAQHIANLLGYSRTYIQFCLARLSDRGHIQRFWRYYKDYRRKRFYYWLNVNLT